MKALVSVLLALVAVSALAEPVPTLRCGTRIIGEGDHQARVAGLCGEPDWVQQRSILRQGIARRDRFVNGRQGQDATRRELQVHQRSWVEVPVEVWVYNLGARRLMREVVFEEGRVVNLETLGYGY